MSDDKVIHAFPPRELPECPVSIERRVRYCPHPRITLVEHDRNIVCAECGAALDPFDYLMKEAFAIRRGWEEARGAGAQAEGNAGRHRGREEAAVMLVAYPNAEKESAKTRAKYGSPP